MEMKGLMEYQHLILGGGLAGAHAVEGIRQYDPKGTIGLLSAEDTQASSLGISKFSLSNIPSRDFRLR